MKEYIKVYKTFDESFCKSILHEIKKNTFETWVFGANTVERSIKEKNNPLSIFYLNDELQEKLMPHITLKIKDYQLQLDGSLFIDRTSYLRTCKYSSGTFRDKHFKDGNQRGGILKFFLSLNDDFENSKLIISDKVIDLNIGDLVIFPNSFMFKTEITEVTKGVRYLLDGIAE